MTAAGSYLTPLIPIAALLTVASGPCQPGRHPAPSPQAAILIRHHGIVSVDAPTTDHAEPWLAIDPANPARAVAVALAGGFQSVAYATADTGKTWRRASREGDDRREFPGGDPVVAFDTEGTAYLATISPFQVWRSLDGGFSWLAPAVVPGRSWDREFLAIRPVAGAVDTLYAVGKMPIKVFGHVASDVLALSRSTDGGRTFEYPRLFLPDPGAAIIHTPGGLLATPDGRLLVSFMAHDVPVRNPALIDNHVWTIRSDDAGRTFADPVAAGISRTHGNAGDLRGMVKSLATAGLAMDTSRSSPWRGRVYLTWVHLLDGRLQVMLAVSSDTGRRWFPPVRVNDDSGTANHSNPGVAVGSTGAVAVLWNDRRDDPLDACFRARVRVSLDGGNRFLPSAPLTAGGACPLSGAETGPFTPDRFAHRFANGGETQGLAPLPDGKFLAIWVDSINGVMQLRASTIEVQAVAPPR